MKKIFLGLALLLTCLSLIAQSRSSIAEGPPTQKSDFKEVYTGTIVSTSGRLVSTPFSLYIKDFTSDEDFSRYLSILAEGDQFDVLKKIRDVDLGNFVPAGQTRRQINVVRKTLLPDGRTRIAVGFERWLRFAEVRNGYRSQDYPFAVMEIFIDAKGKGSGTYIAACAVDMKRDKKTGQYNLELENFGTYPQKVMGVRQREKKL